MFCWLIRRKDFMNWSIKECFEVLAALWNEVKNKENLWNYILINVLSDKIDKIEKIHKK